MLRYWWVFLGCFSVTCFAQVEGRQEQKITQKNYQYGAIEFLVEQEVGKLVVPEIYRRLGLHATILSYPANRAQELAKSGKTDGEIMRIWSYGLEHKNLLRVPTPYHELETMPFVMANSGIHITEQSQLKHYRVVRVRGVKHTINITNEIEHVHVVASTEKMFELLKSGKVDVALTNTLDGIAMLKRMSAQEPAYKKIIPMKKPLATLPLYHYLHQKHSALLPLLDAQIYQMKISGQLQMLIKEAEQQVLARY